MTATGMSGLGTFPNRCGSTTVNPCADDLVREGHDVAR